MDLRWLEDVLVLLEEGNLSRAARRRAITQPAFSRRIRAFEHWLGQDILDRQCNRVHLRKGLRDSETEIRTLVRRLGELQRRVRSAESAGRTVTLTAQHALAQSMMSDLILLSRRELGAIGFRLLTADRSECISTFVRGDAELLVCYIAPGDPNLMFDESFVQTILGQDALLPVLDPALARDPLAEDLAEIGYPESSYLGQVLVRAQRNGDLRLPKALPVCDTEFSTAAREMALRGLGLAWLPASLVGHDVRAGRLADLSAVFGSAPMKIALYARPDAGPDAALVAGVAGLTGRLARLVDPPPFGADLDAGTAKPSTA